MPASCWLFCWFTLWLWWWRRMEMMFFWNVGWLSADYKGIYPRRYKNLQTQLWEPHIQDTIVWWRNLKDVLDKAYGTLKIIFCLRVDPYISSPHVCLSVKGNGIFLYPVERDWSKDIISVLTTCIVWSLTTCCRPDFWKPNPNNISTVYWLSKLKTCLRIPGTYLNTKLGYTSPWAGLHNVSTEAPYNSNIPRKQTNDNLFCLKVKVKKRGQKRFTRRFDVGLYTQ
jgi:hypothetical protein